ncbi:hypothetical protein N7520_007229 [Penicillium odoratum]|uniref:uncharacterized protein n=1 Tax=Penicillium odoratum TaxID=1167516 RepID=UPI00254818A4|nr:uncharacterized protein N7520_007229 [Penicillium odoratum]KAJ5760073.1 hypothetical protein N7520_007229 [Penicillium odoratum]
MRSFFNKPAWAVKGGVTTNEFYRRSEQTYSDIIAANREAYKKPKDPLEPDKPSSCSDEVNLCSKRPRLSDEPKKDAIDAPALPHDEQDKPREDRSLSTCLKDTPNASVIQHTIEEKEYSRIPLLGVSDSCLTDTPSRNHTDHSAPTHLSAHPSASPVARGKINTEARSAISPEHQLSKSSEPLADDPVVQILITSDIPNTKPLLVHRKMSQGLREVRLEWCKRQGFTTGAESPVHLTWRGSRLFDVTTCRSLRIEPEKNTWALLDMDDDSLTGPKELRIHLEAVADDPILLNRSGSSASPAPPSPINQQDEVNEPMKLTLRNPGLGDLRIKARPKTLVFKLISAFRDKHNLSTDQEISLVFDGDRLDPSTCLGEHDIADLDLVDVQIKTRI